MEVEKNEGLNQEWLVNVVQKKYNERTLGKLISVKIEPVISEGMSCTSEAKRIKMVFGNENDKERTVTLVAKINKAVESDREGEDFWSNRVEVEVYTNVLHEMENLMVEFNDNREMFWPEMYGYVPYSVLLLEDLEQRQIMLPRSDWLHDEYAFLVLRTLWRYHAMSKVLIRRGCIDEQYRNKFISGNRNPFHEKFFGGSVLLLSEAVTNKLGFWKSVESNEFLGKRLKSLAQTIVDKRIENYHEYDERFEVLNHGDVRSGNMMFRMMEYTGRPIDVKFFDFQLPHINSFGWDVAYFLSLSVEPSFRRAHRFELLDAYRQSLEDNLTLFHYDGYIPTIDDVVQEMDRMAIVALSNMMTVTPFAISTLEDALIVEKIVTHPMEEAMNILVFTEEKYVKGILGDLERAVELNLI